MIDTVAFDRAKEKGNDAFKAGRYEEAESFYTQAITHNPKNIPIYTNRAMSRLRLPSPPYASIIDDCTTALTLCKTDSSVPPMKALYITSLAECALKDYDPALAHAREAQQLCIQNRDVSLKAVTEAILKIKKLRWEKMEKDRVREEGALEDELQDLVRSRRDEEMREVGDSEVACEEMRVEFEEKLERMKQVFEKARAETEREREVPAWLLCDLTYDVLVDPVMSHSGKSYERSAIYEYIRISGKDAKDPITREPLSIEDLRPNRQLREACEEFVKKNGWVLT